MTLDPPPPTPLTLKWERRKTVSSTHTPTARAGCTTVLWLAKSTGVMFGGVTDEERGEKALETCFGTILWIPVGSNGRCIAMHVKRPERKVGVKVTGQGWERCNRRLTMARNWKMTMKRRQVRYHACIQNVHAAF
ncbi:hypothetical protein JVU11DRAFT_11853 [Chiua virens]|nr:hypothetical protein JVU11DRAFT_11853 [Chiua virens]